ncbi:unnamed protein product [Angiostrongylus costaricensis]|uniref:Uncharacterized protein n=1 Tax=Angiostrongylus costaricensis TaxID=334426 RepID=A0A0R3PHD3_ANGCS|nr:unnamed protein product [Angiostrongylus costaricensis]
MVLPLLLFLPFVVAEPFVYVYPVNPKLHPRNLYPIQRSLRGVEKIRDLPRSGIVYLNRIKPISEEFKGVIVHGNSTFVKSETSGPLAQLQARNNDTLDEYTDNRPFINMTSIDFDDAVTVDETSTGRPFSTPPPMRTTIASDPRLKSTVIPLPSTKSVKNLLKLTLTKSSKKEEHDSSEEARPNLMHLINYIRTKNKVNFIEKDPKVETIKMPEVRQGTTDKKNEKKEVLKNAKEAQKEISSHFVARSVRIAQWLEARCYGYRTGS